VVRFSVQSIATGFSLVLLSFATASLGFRTTEICRLWCWVEFGI
jgi:hypothetical protein